MDLVGIAEIARMLEVSPQRAWKISRKRGFPKPLDQLAMGPVWRRAQVERWAERSGRAPLSAP